MLHAFPAVHRSAAPIVLASVASLLTSILGSCGSSDDDSSGASGDVGAAVTTYVGILRESGIASFRRGDATFQSSFQIINEAEGGFALDFLGNLYQADPTGAFGPGAIRVMSQARLRTFGNGTGTGLGSFNPLFDRSIEGASTTLAEPRSVALAHGQGLLMVADSGDSTVKVLGASAGGDVPPS